MYKILENGRHLAVDSGYARTYDTFEEAEKELKEYIETEYPINTDGHIYDIVKEQIVRTYVAKASVSLEITRP